MTLNEWTAWVSDACTHANCDPPLLTQRLIEEAASQNTEDAENVIQRALLSPQGHLSSEQKIFVDQLIEPTLAYLLNSAEHGHLLGPISRVYEKYGDNIDDVLNSGSNEYQKLAKVFITFDTELDDLATSNRSLLLYHVLKEVEVFVRGVFFPSAGPNRIPVPIREQKMKQLLAAFAPSLNCDAFYNNNPVLDNERSSVTSIWPEMISLFGGILIAILVPSQHWWGKVIFWVAVLWSTMTLWHIVTQIRSRVAGGKR